MPSCATDAANSSRSARGNGSTKLRWNDSYNDFWRSSAIRRILARVGETKYTAGTSGSGGRSECSCLKGK